MSTPDLRLSNTDQALLAGAQGEAAQRAMRILVTMAGVYGARELLTIDLAHIDGCLYHGESGLEFAEQMLAGGASVTVPTTLNVGAIDLLHPENFRGTPELASRARRLMECYQEMGCQPIWTCTPYQQLPRPALGQQIAWAESNAIVFANSVLGARTNRYGDFIDICAAITGRAPACGLHLDEGRRGEVVFRLGRLGDHWLEQDVLYALLGYHVGIAAGQHIPVIEGLPTHATEDQLKALGAAAASSGAVALFHAVGVTPEAPTLEAALHGRPPSRVDDVTSADLEQVARTLCTSPDREIHVVALGSPHFSIGEFEQLLPLLTESPPSPDVEFVVCTNRLVHWQLQKRGWTRSLERLGVRVVVDTCVVVAPILETEGGVLMTNSGKFAHYAPGNIGVGVVFGSLDECVQSAARGRVWRDPDLWSWV